MSSRLYSQNINNIQYENRNYFIPSEKRMNAFQEFIHRYKSKYIDYLSIKIDIVSLS